MTKKSPRKAVFAVCIDNNGYPASLETGKLYAVVPDAEAAKHGLIRVVDESGEDYGYSAERFFVIGLPRALEKALKGISATKQPITTLKPPSGASSSKARRAGRGRRLRLGA